jgi:hypothetical protein
VRQMIDNTRVMGNRSDIRISWVAYSRRGRIKPQGGAWERIGVVPEG